MSQLISPGQVRPNSRHPILPTCVQRKLDQKISPSQVVIPVLEPLTDSQILSAIDGSKRIPKNHVNFRKYEKKYFNHFSGHDYGSSDVTVVDSIVNKCRTRDPVAKKCARDDRRVQIARTLAKKNRIQDKEERKVGKFYVPFLKSSNVIDHLEKADHREYKRKAQNYRKNGIRFQCGSDPYCSCSAADDKPCEYNKVLDDLDSQKKSFQDDSVMSLFSNPYSFLKPLLDLITDSKIGPWSTLTVTDFSHHCIGLIYNIHKCNGDVFGIYINVYIFLSYVFSSDDDISVYLRSSFSDVLTSYKTRSHEIHFQSGFKTLKGLVAYARDSLEVVERFKSWTDDSTFFQSFRGLVLSVLSLHLFPKNMAFKVYDFIGRDGSEKYDGLMPALLGICRGAKDLLDCFGNYLETGSWEKVSITYFELKRARAHVAKCLSMFDDNLITYSSVKESEIPEDLSLGAGQVSRIHCRYFLRDLSVSLRVILIHLRAKHTTLSQNLIDPDYTLFLKGDAVRSKVRSNWNSKRRIPPITLMVVGEAGVGKSAFMDLGAAIMCQAYGIPFNRDLVFHRCMSSPYHEGYSPDEHLIIHYSEMGAKKDDKVSGSDPYADEFLSVNDSQPMYANMAFTEKGKIRLDFLGAVLDSNDDFCGFKATNKNLAAVMRRVLRAKISSKPEYRFKGGVGVDYSKVAASGVNNLDIWDITVETFTSAPGGVPQPLFSKTFNSSKEFGRFFYTHCRNHIESNSKLSEVLSDTNINSFVNSFSGLEALDNALTGFINPHEDFKDVEANVDKAISLAGDAPSVFITAQSGASDIYDNMLSRFDILKTLIGESSRVSRVLFVDMLRITYAFCRENYYMSLIIILSFLFFGHFRVVGTLLFLFSVFSFTLSRIGSFTSELRSFRGRVDNLLGFINSSKVNTVVKRSQVYITLSTLIQLFSVAVIANVYIKFLSKKKTEIAPQGSVLSKDNTVETDKTKVTKINNYFENKSELIRRKTAGMANWNILVGSDSPSHTGLAEDLAKSLVRQTRLIKVTSDSALPFLHIFGLRSDIAVIPRHVFSTSSFPAIVSMEYPLRGLANQTTDSKIRLQDLIPLKYDLNICRFSHVTFSDKTKHYTNTLPRSGRGYIGLTPVVFNERYNVVCSAISMDVVYEYHYPENDDGHCGFPLICQFNNGSAIIGHHIGANGPYGYAIPVSRKDIDVALSSLSSSSPLMTITPQSSRLFGSLKVPNRKHPIHHEDFIGIEFLGQVDKPVTLPKKSSVVKTPFSKQYDVRLMVKDVFGVEVTKEWGPPLMKPTLIDGVYMPYNGPMTVMAQKRPPLDKTIMEKVVKESVDYFVTTIKRDNPTLKLSPFGFYECASGSVCDEFLRRMNLKTSAGFSLGGLKGDHITIDSSGVKFSKILMESLSSRINYILDYGEVDSQICVVSLKDEPRSMDKVLSGKTRLFYVQDLVDVILNKSFLGPVLLLTMQYNDLFMNAVGIDMHTEGWKIFKDAHFSSLSMDWDHKDYDLSMSRDISLMMSTVILSICREFGYSEDELAITQAILSATISPVLCLLGCLMRAEGVNPSGRWDTALLNSLCGTMMLWYTYTAQGGSDFPKYIKARFYGDDSTVKVHPDCPIPFDTVIVTKCYKEFFNMTITDPDKSSTIKKFYRPEHINFLKRSFVWSDLYKDILCPLDISSLVRMLDVHIPSKNVTISDQMKSTVVSFIIESFYHLDCIKFHELVARIHLMWFSSFPSVYLDNDLPLWSDLFIKRFYASLSYRCQEGKTAPHPLGDVVCCVLCRGDNLAEGQRNTSGDSCPVEPDCLPRVADTSHLRSLLSDFHTARESLLEQVDQKDPLFQADPQYVRRSFVYASNSVYRDHAEKVFTITSSIQAYNNSIDRLEKILANQTALQISQQSGILGMSGIAPDHEHKVGTMEDESGDTMLEPMPEITLNTTSIRDNEYDIKKLFARPVFIGTSPWTIGSDLDLLYDISSLFFGDPTIRSKLRNVAWIRGDFNVMVSVSGSPFLVGSLLMALIPMFNENVNFRNLLAGTLVYPATRYNAIKALSSYPGACVTTAALNSEISLKMPFILPIHAVRCFNSSNVALAAASDFTDAESMLMLRISSLNQLLSCSPTPVNGSITVYAHMTNIKLGPPTASQMVITTQSGNMSAKMKGRKAVVPDKKDERVVGPVELISSRAAQVANTLTAVPWIAPFAAASEVVLSGVSKFAALFGWSISNLNTAPVRMKNQPFQNAANLIGYDTGMRITLDPKQEITIDPRIVGVEEDQMAIRNIAKRFSLVHQFLWNTSTVPNNVPITQMGVHPRTGAYVSAGLTNATQPSWLEFVASAFAAWRGTIRIWVCIVCGPLQKGKIAITYEPNPNQAGLIGAATSMNKQFERIIDIQDTQNVILDIEWSSPRDWLQVGPPSAGYIGSPTLPAIGTVYSEFLNGYLSFYPITQLQSPNNTPCYVNVFYSCPDLQVNEPTPTNLPVGHFAYQSGNMESGQCNAYGALCCLPIEVETLNPTGCSPDEACLHTYGEQPVSFRALLHRFETTNVQNIVANSSTKKYVLVTAPNMPAAQNVGAIQADNTLLTYLKGAYLGWRGGLRKRVRIRGVDVNNSKNGVMDRLEVLLATPGATYILPSVNWITGQADSNFVGSVANIPSTNGGIEFEIPYYTNSLFAPTQVNGFTSSSGTATYFPSWGATGYVVKMEFELSTVAMTFIEETATADDFSLLRLLTPPVYSST